MTENKSILKKIIFLIIIIFIIIGFIQIGGIYIDINDSIDKQDSIELIMTAKEHNSDIEIDTNIADGYKLLYNSLKDGDRLIIRDVISSISYYPEVDATKIVFEWSENEKNDSLEVFIKGDITSEYFKGDEVKISVTIKYVNFIFNNYSFEMEIFNEQWESEEYFYENAGTILLGFKPIPKSAISKE